MNRKTKKNIAVAALCIVALLVLAAGFGVRWYLTPPPMPDTVDEAMALQSSPRYARLTDAQKERYTQRMQQIMEKLSDEQRRELFEKSRDNPALRAAGGQMMQQMMFARAEAFVRASPEERVRQLDQEIDRMQAMRKMFASLPSMGAPPPGFPRPPGSSRPPGAPPADFIQRAQEGIQKGDPQRQAYMTEFFTALRQRALDRGIEMPAGPPGPPPG
jgi:hypothetical protein